jgi:LAS seventeen-binding protein 5
VVRPPTPENESSNHSRHGSASTASSSPKPERLTPPRPSNKKPKSREEPKTKSSFKPINFEKERHLILQTIANSQQSATNLTNALKHLNRETQNPEDDQQIQQLYRQCRKLRRDILTYIQRTESEEWVGTLINANEELMQALAHYEKAMKSVDQDSDSDAFNASNSDEERATKPVVTQKRMSTGGSGRNAIAEDLAQRLRATSLTQESPPPKPPRPIVESPPAKPPRPMRSSLMARLFTSKSCLIIRGKQPVEEEEDDDDPFGDQHVIDTPNI